MKLQLVHVELKEANNFVAAHHRHHKPTRGHRFSLGAEIDGHLVAVAICGRPVARLAPPMTVEVLRLCTDGTPNACSFLLGACARASKALGYHRIQTYILGTENGASLKAANWTDEGPAGGGVWSHTDGKLRRTDQPIEQKRRWALILNN